MSALAAGTVVYKMTGSGNDFVIADGRYHPPERWTAESIRAICERRTGLGADGLVVLVPGDRAGRVRFHFFNNDGSRASMCGNAALCATRLACWLGLTSSDEVVLESDAGEVHGRCLEGEGERAEIALPSPGPLSQPDIPLEPGERAIWFTEVGVPHLVLLVDDVASVPLSPRGRALREHPAVAPTGANVNFLSSGERGWTMRTYERGVEAETLACGTGAVACAAALVGAGEASLPLELVTTSGRTLGVTAKMASQGRLVEPRLEGEGRIVYRAILGR